MSCSQPAEEEAKNDEILTQEHSEPTATPALIDSLGIEDELFQEDDSPMFLPTLDFQNSVRPDCNPIEGKTLAKLMKEGNHQIIIVDARFDYEYNYGHIKGAINIDNQNLLERTFLHDLEKLRQLMRSRTIIVFHCEFSQKRGPSLWQTLRGLDRNINMAKYPKLFYPEMYLLEKGFSAFHANYPELCDGGYKA